MVTTDYADTSVLYERILPTRITQDVNQMKRKVLRDNQYGRLENIEIGGIPQEIKQEYLEDKVIQVLNEIGIKVTKMIP